MSSISTLERQVSTAGNRRSDRWAWADFGECRLVIGDHEGAQVAYREFLRVGDEDSKQSALEKTGDDAARSVRLGIEWLEKPALPPRKSAVS